MGEMGAGLMSQKYEPKRLEENEKKLIFFLYLTGSVSYLDNTLGPPKRIHINHS